MICEYVNMKAAKKKNAVRLKCNSMTNAQADVFPAAIVHRSECCNTTAQHAITRNVSN